MSDHKPTQQSPMVHIAFVDAGVSAEKLQIEELPFRGHINLRGSSDNLQFVSAVESVLGLSPVMDANTMLRNEDYSLLWYGPNEWLILTEPGVEIELLASLSSVLDGMFAAITDVSGGNTILQIKGSAARDLLSSGSMIDFHSSQFSAGDCVQTLFAKTNVTVYCCDENVFRMIVRRSFADYLAKWLIETAPDLP